MDNENLLYGNNKLIEDHKLYKIIEEFNFFGNDKISLEYQVNNKSFLQVSYKKFPLRDRCLMIQNTL